MKTLATATAICVSLLPLVWGQSETTTFVLQDLNAADWSISNQNGTVSLSDVELPVMVLEALYAAGKLSEGDPIAGYNDRNYAWVAEDTWTFEAELNVTREIIGQEQVDLVLSGIDTVAEVYVNDQLVAELNNAHRGYRLSVKAILMEGSNLLSIIFYPATTYAKMKAADYPLTVPMQTYDRGFDHFNFIRKPASDFGWDWGPAFSPSGIYGGVVLEAYSTAFLTGASIRQQHNDNGQIELFFDAIIQSPASDEAGSLRAEADSENWSESQDVILDKGENIVTIKVVVDGNYYLWWPAGFGAPYLYNFTLTYATNTSVSSQSGESSLARRVGFRTIELVEEPLRSPAGFSFYFRVNGVPMYARGANMIPLQVFHSQNSAEKYRRMVEDAILANMNMLRIWGGGLYQADAFYDIADELGVLIWQEAMFACAQYPRDAAFLENVKEEIIYQARRIGHHASLAIWGGNNEVETAFGWFPESRANEKLFSVDYSTLFVSTVREAIIAVDPNIPFVDSSPSKGVYSLDPYIKRWGNPSDVSSGDVHFYDYSSNCLDPAIYPRAKFVSEYGFQSYPSFSIYKLYTEEKDWSIQSNMSDYRQRHPNGNSELMTQMQSHFLPIAANATNAALQVQLFQQWIYLTQVQQSLCYEIAITNWRRLKAAPDARTMGVLYWQLNDIWAGPSWSGVDHGGHWKLLMYNLRKVFEPVAVSGTYNVTLADALSVYVTNDQPWTVQGEVTVEVISWGARGYDQPVISKTTAYTLGPLSSQVITSLAIKSKLQNASLTLMDAVVRLKSTALGDTQELAAQMCSAVADDPFASICTPARGMNAPPTSAPVSAVGRQLKRTPTSSRNASADGMAPASAPDGYERYDSEQVVWLSEPKKAALALDPRIRTGQFTQVDGKSASFRISSRSVAAFVYLDTDEVDGIFSNNGFLLLPWEAQTITFASRNDFSASDLRDSLTVMSLADTLAGGGPTTF